MVEATVLERPVEAARHIMGRLSVRPEPKLSELRERLSGLARDQRDVVISTRELAMAPVDGALMVGGNERYTLREHAFGQIAAKLAIPAHYLRRCDPDLRARNVNRWLREADRDLMLRLEGGEVRAVLSGSYRVINHADILGWLESRLGENAAVRYELTEGYLDLQVVGDHETGLPLQPESGGPLACLRVLTLVAASGLQLRRWLGYKLCIVLALDAPWGVFGP